MLDNTRKKRCLTNGYFTPSFYLCCRVGRLNLLFFKLLLAQKPPKETLQ